MYELPSTLKLHPSGFFDFNLPLEKNLQWAMDLERTFFGEVVIPFNYENPHQNALFG